MYRYETAVKLHDTDAAGLLFFANQLKMAHDAYESFLDQIGFGFSRIFNEKEFFLPIVHAEADYKSALAVGDKLMIHLTVGKIGETSFTLDYELIDKDSQLVGRAQTVHVCTDTSSGKKRPLPDELRQKLETAT